MNKKLVVILTSLFGLVTMVFNSKNMVVVAKKDSNEQPPMVTCYAPKPPTDELKEENKLLKKEQKENLEQLNKEGKISDETYNTVKKTQSSSQQGEEIKDEKDEPGFNAVQDLLYSDDVDENDDDDDDLPMDEIRRMQGD